MRPHFWNDLLAQNILYLLWLHTHYPVTSTVQDNINITIIQTITHKMMIGFVENFSLCEIKTFHKTAKDIYPPSILAVHISITSHKYAGVAVHCIKAIQAVLQTCQL